jgi:hypothetical protein
VSIDWGSQKESQFPSRNFAFDEGLLPPACLPVKTQPSESQILATK